MAINEHNACEIHWPKFCSDINVCMFNFGSEKCSRKFAKLEKSRKYEAYGNQSSFRGDFKVCCIQLYLMPSFQWMGFQNKGQSLMNYYNSIRLITVRTTHSKYNFNQIVYFIQVNCYLSFVAVTKSLLQGFSPAVIKNRYPPAKNTYSQNYTSATINIKKYVLAREQTV